MPTKKQKQKKNEDFKKVKLKVGKKLKKTSTTDTTIHAKKLVLTSQLGEKVGSEDAPLSFRGLSLDELCKQLGHFNKNVRRDALMGTKQLLTSRPDLISLHLRTLIPSIARLLSESGSDSSLNTHLRGLLAVICTASEHAMTAHFTLFLAHILRAITHMELDTRILALSALGIIMTSYPKLCRNNAELFHSFVKFLGSSRKPSWNAPKFLESILSFLNVFDVARTASVGARQEVVVNTCDGSISDVVDMLYSKRGGNPFDFAVITSSATVSASPFELPESLLSLSQALAPIITTSLMDDKAGAFLSTTIGILEAVSRAVDNQPNAFLIPDFHKKLSTVWSTVKKAASTRKSERVQKATQWIQ